MSHDLDPDEWMLDGEVSPLPRPAESYTPKEISDMLSDTVVGQDAAKKAASIIMYNHMKGKPSVSVFCGPSGCGKTEIWRALSYIFVNEIVIHDASTLTAEGWKGGNKLSGILRSLLRPNEEKLRAVLVLDEFDKCLEPQYGANDTNYSDLIQGQMLRLFAHDSVFIGNEEKAGAYMDCSGVSIVCLGAFQRLLEQKSEQTGSIGFGAAPKTKLSYANTEITQEDLVEYGMRTELAGRVDRIVCMDPLSVDMLVQIGRQMIDEITIFDDVDIDIQPDAILMLARAASRKAFGARWMLSQIRRMIIFIAASATCDNVCFTYASVSIIFIVSFRKNTKKTGQKQFQNYFCPVSFPAFALCFHCRPLDLGYLRHSPSSAPTRPSIFSLCCLPLSAYIIPHTT